MPSVGLRTAAAIAEMMQQRVAIECPRGDDDATAPACETVRPIELESYQRKRWPVRTIVFSRKPSKRFPPLPCRLVRKMTSEPGLVGLVARTRESGRPSAFDLEKIQKKV